MIYLTVVLVRLFFQVVILFCKVSVLSCKGVVMLFLALMGAINGYNRRRAVRKALERDRARRDAAYAARGSFTPRVPVQDPWESSWTPAWQQAEPRDNPNWVPRG
jgi:hypothetical protein